MATEEAVKEIPASETDDSWVNLAEERSKRGAAEPPAAAEPRKEGKPEPSAEPAKTAPVTEAGTTEEEETEEAAEVAKLPRGLQRKFNKLTRARGDAERARDDLQRTVTDLQARLKALETPKTPAKAEEAKSQGDPEPKQDDFKDYNEYVKALGRWVARQELKTATDSAQKEQATQAENDRKARAKEVFDGYVEALRKVRESHTDYDLVMKDAQIPDYIHNRLVRMENGAEAAYALVKEKKTLVKILELNDAALKRGDGDFSEAYWEFGAFVRSLQSSSEKKPEKPASQAPAPITPVGGAGGSSEMDLESEQVSLSDYRKKRGR